MEKNEGKVVKETMKNSNVNRGEERREREWGVVGILFFFFIFDFFLYLISTNSFRE